MKRILALLAIGVSAAALAAGAQKPGPCVMDAPAGTECRTWMENGNTFLEVVNRTGRTVSGTVTLNEIYEKVINVTNRYSAEIDGRWIEIELPAGKSMTLRLGK